MTKWKNSEQQNSQSKDQNKSKTFPYKIVLAVLFIALISFFILSNLTKKNKKDEDYVFKKQGELTFLAMNNRVKTKIDIQIADNEFDRELGLMFRKKMNGNQGMLFIFPQTRIQIFWMRNTYLPLDMIFIDSTKEIVTIKKNTTPLSDKTYASSKPVQYVLEVNAGFCNKFNIKVGDKVGWTKDKTGLSLK